MTDDNEEVFRRAAENYPLNTANADWEAVRKKMEDSDASPNDIPTPKKRKYWPLLLLLLLLSLIVIENKWVHYFTGKDKQSSAAVTSAGKSDKKSLETINLPVTNNASQEQAANNATASPDPATSNTVSPATTEQKQAIRPGTNIADHGTRHPQIQAVVSTAVPDHSNLYNGNSGLLSNNPLTAQKIPHKKIMSASKQKTTIGIENADLNEDETAKSILAENKHNPAVTTGIEKALADAANTIKKQDGKLKEEVIDVNKKEITKLEDKDQVNQSEKKQPEKSNSKQSHFYAGLVGGIDLSTIKMQSVKKTGYSYGLLAGYKINKRFSIETAFLLDKKSYSSEGKYFSTKKIPMPAYAQIQYVSGDCHMSEWPVNLRYNFSTGKKTSLFATAGISSYFMSKETYIFDVKHYNETYPYNANYKKHDNQFAAVINFSAGYTHRIGKIGDVRIEPYLKLPVSKLGTGDLPIQSAGLLIGITKNLF